LRLSVDYKNKNTTIHLQTIATSFAALFTNVRSLLEKTKLNFDLTVIVLCYRLSAKFKMVIAVSNNIILNLKTKILL
jgi:hypothetical protein